MRRSLGGNRRSFIQKLAVSSTCFAVGSFGLEERPARGDSIKTTQLEPDGYFSIYKRNDRWWLLTPSGKPFFTLGLNHIDPATLRYPENIHLWREKYGGSTIRWIRASVAPNLRSWGFNSVGWVQEVTVKKWQHSRPFTIDEYRTLGMPYCHLLPFTESHQWEKNTAHYDYRSADWKEWVDYVARSHCAELAGEKDLIGYFYSDCPTWTHSRPDNEWRGPIFDPERLKTEAGRRELVDLATTYYQTTHDAIRRYDKHHLILGDRYEANAPIADEVVRAALPYVDVLSFQDFRDPVKHLREWHRKTQKPVLLADAAGVNRQSDGFYKPNNGAWYAEVLKGLQQNPGCIGFHLCGAYQRNKARRRGLLDELEKPDREQLELIITANDENARWLEAQL